MNGDKEGNFNPKNNATRAEVAVVVQRLDTLLATAKEGRRRRGGGGGGGGGGVVAKARHADCCLHRQGNLGCA